MRPRFHYGGESSVASTFLYIDIISEDIANMEKIAAFIIPV